VCRCFVGPPIPAAIDFPSKKSSKPLPMILTSECSHLCFDVMGCLRYVRREHIKHLDSKEWHALITAREQGVSRSRVALVLCIATAVPIDCLWHRLAFIPNSPLLYCGLTSAHKVQAMLFLALFLVAIVIFGIGGPLLRACGRVRSLPQGPWGYPILGMGLFRSQ
jgi:hypothetical protein